MAPSRRRSYAVGAAVAWISGGLAYLIFEAVAAAAFRPRYSYARNLVSDLGATSPQAWLMNTGFCLQGTLFLVGAVLAVRAVDARKARLFLALAAANAVGNVLIAFFHSGPSGTPWVHASGAVLAIAGGNAAILAGSSVISGPSWYRRVSLWLGGFGLLSFAMFAIESTTTAVHLLPPAVWERCSVYPITTWQVLTAAWLLLNRQPILSRAQARRA